MDLVQLRTFVAVAEEQHLTRAAERIHISQPAASGHIKALEETYGVELFTRTNRRLELTYAGKQLLERSKDLLRQATELRSFARQLAGEISGTVSFGCHHDPTLSRIGEVANELRIAYPGINLRVFRRTSSASNQGLQTGELDVAVFVGQATDKSFEYRTLNTVRYCIAGSTRWKDSILRANWSELATLPWISPVSNLPYFDALNEPFKQHGLTMNTVVEADSDVLIGAMIANGVGLSVLREDHALIAETKGEMVVLPGWGLSREVLLAYPLKRQDDPVVKAFVHTMSSVWRG